MNEDKNKVGHKYTEQFKKLIKDFYKDNNDDLEKTLNWIRKIYPNFKRKILRTWVDDEYALHIKQIRERNNRNWRQRHPEKYAEISKKNNEVSVVRYRDKRIASNKNWRNERLEHTKQYQKQWWEKNKDKELERKRKRKQEDPAFKILENTRTYIWQQLQKALKSSGKEYIKEESTCELIGCTPTEYLNHLRSHYKPGMTDENYGEWHTDHVIPCAAFDLTDREQLKKCFHYSNVRPLWAHENLSKSNKII